MKNNQLKVGVILSYISRFIQILVGFLYTPVMIRLLGQSEYGLYNMVSSIVAYLGVLNLGLGSSYVRFFSRYKVNSDEERINNLNGMFIIIFLVLGLVALLAGLFLTNNLEIIYGPSLSSEEIDTAKTLMLMLVINLALSLPASVFNSYVQANENFIFLNSLQIVRQLSSPLLSLPLLLSGKGAFGLVLAQVVVNVICELITVIYALRKLGMRFELSKFDLDLFKEITSYSFFIFINMIVDQVNQNLDKTIIGRYRGTTATAIYSLGERIELMYQNLSTSISSVFTPRIHLMVSSEASDTELTGFFTRVGRIQFLILSLVLFGFIFFGRPFVSFWAGDDYQQSYLIAVILMISITPPLIQNVGIEIQRAKNMHQFRSFLYIVIAIFSILITIPAVKYYSILGAAFATGLSYIIGNGFIMNWYYHQKIGLNIPYFWKNIFQILKAYVIPVILGIILVINIDLYQIGNFLLSGIVFLIVTLLCLWFIAMNDYEKNLVKNYFK